MTALPTEPAADLAADLAACESLLHDTVRSDGNPLLGAVADHLLRAGGKRLRPRLALLAARFGDPGRPGVVEAAATVELIHVASLYHDDVMDGAALRRGVPSVNARWGNSVAILAGDYLVVRAAELAVRVGPAATLAQAAAVRRLVEGQLNEATGAGGADAEARYLRVVADKTAALFVLAVRLGGDTAGAPAEHVAALVAYAEQLGIAFQLCDDVLDIAVPATRSGKAAGTDLRQGLRTLPVLRALGARPVGRRDARELRRALAAGATGDTAAHRRALDLLRRSPGLSESAEQVVAYVGRARAALLRLPDVPARAELDRIAASVARTATEALAGGAA